MIALDEFAKLLKSPFLGLTFHRENQHIFHQILSSEVVARRWKVYDVK